MGVLKNDSVCLELAHDVTASHKPAVCRGVVTPVSDQERDERPGSDCAGSFQCFGSTKNATAAYWKPTATITKAWKSSW